MDPHQSIRQNYMYTTPTLRYIDAVRTSPRIGETGIRSEIFSLCVREDWCSVKRDIEPHQIVHYICTASTSRYIGVVRTSRMTGKLGLHCEILFLCVSEDWCCVT